MAPKLRMPVLTHEIKAQASTWYCGTCGAAASEVGEERGDGTQFGTCANGHENVRLRPRRQFTTSGLQDQLFEVMDMAFAEAKRAGKALPAAKNAAVKAGRAAIDPTDADAVAVSKGMLAFWKNQH